MVGQGGRETSTFTLFAFELFWNFSTSTAKTSAFDNCGDEVRWGIRSKNVHDAGITDNQGWPYKIYLRTRHKFYLQLNKYNNHFESGGCQFHCFIYSNEKIINTALVAYLKHVKKFLHSPGHLEWVSFQYNIQWLYWPVHSIMTVEPIAQNRCCHRTHAYIICIHDSLFLPSVTDTTLIPMVYY